MRQIILILSAGFVFVMLVLSGCVNSQSYMIPMRDDVLLATDAHLDRKVRSETGSILIRTPYNKDPLAVIGKVWAREGWPTVIQDMRGRFASEGRDTVFRNAHTDGPDTLAWIANQSWSNGKIATFGGSALGICQYFLAGTNPPNLACQYVQVASPNLHKHAMYQGGEFRYQLVVKWLEKQGSTYILPEVYEQENYSLAYWTNVSLEDNWADVNVPAIHIGGWYDCFSQGTLDGFMGYHYRGGAGAQGKSKLIMGPWTHGGAFAQKQGELEYPENCKDTFSQALFWEMVREFTRDQPGGFNDWPTVYYYVMGDVTDASAPGNEWREADQWPLNYNETAWYFHHDGVLSKDIQGMDEPVTYLYDPTNPVPTVGGQNLNQPAGPFDQSSVESRDDVLVFTSDFLAEPYEATGPIKARLFVSSDCPDTDFTVKLTDVYPDGRSMLITDGILRMRNRNGSDHWEFMEEGEIYEVTVDLWSSSYIWNTGHKIRVAISSSNAPRFLPNPNTADPMMKNTSSAVAQNMLYLDEQHPSCILLPQIDEELMSSTYHTTMQRDIQSVLLDKYSLDWKEGIIKK